MADYTESTAEGDDDEAIDMTGFGIDLPHLEPDFGVRPHTPFGRCPCGKRGYKKGSAFVCMGCHRSGRDHWAIFRNVRPKPAERRPGGPTRYVPHAKPAAAADARETRKQRRSRHFAAGPPRKAG